MDKANILMMRKGLYEDFEKFKSGSIHPLVMNHDPAEPAHDGELLRSFAAWRLASGDILKQWATATSLVARL